MQKIHINASSQYDVSVEAGLISSVGEIIKSSGITGKLAVVTDSNVEKLLLMPLIHSLKTAGYEVCSYTFPAGERSKNLTTLSHILEFFARSGLTRGDCAVALGGGVTGDITGFAAGCYMRGISYIQVPTTLLAAVDSSVGGKTAVDLDAGKNLAGIFIQPKAVICDSSVISVLPDEIFADGVAEAIKAGILGDPVLFGIFESGHVRESIDKIIIRSITCKGLIVASDEFETGERRLLNLGHTPSHAIEKLSGYKITHGHAVAMGLAIMTRAAARSGLINKNTARRIVNVIHDNRLPVCTPYSAEELAREAVNDKKRVADGITIVVPREIGRCTLEHITLDDYEKFIESGIKELI